MLTSAAEAANADDTREVGKWIQRAAGMTQGANGC